jgi:hypothetical protein
MGPLRIRRCHPLRSLSRPQRDSDSCVSCCVVLQMILRSLSLEFLKRFMFEPAFLYGYCAAHAFSNLASELTNVVISLSNLSKI